MRKIRYTGRNGGTMKLAKALLLLMALTGLAGRGAARAGAQAGVQAGVLAGVQGETVAASHSLTGNAADVALPPADALIASLKQHQAEIGAVTRRFVWHALRTTNELDGKGNVKKTKSEEWENFIVHDRRYSRMVARDGKPLDADEAAKEKARVDKIIADREARPPQSAPKTAADSVNPLSPEGILKFCTLTNERWEDREGRRVVAFDFQGSPEVQGKDRLENAMKSLAGTLWIDAEAKQMVSMHIHVEKDIKVGGGLLASFQKGSGIEFDQTRVHGQVWLPSKQVQHVSARILLLKGMHEDTIVEFRDYKEFKAGMTIVDGATVAVPED